MSNRADRYQPPNTRRRRLTAANLAKYGVGFDEATTALGDEQGFVLPDPDHSDAEDGFILLGLSAGLRVLVVAHCLGQSGRVRRLISTRRVSRIERQLYATKNP